jgi:hypothetical protein
MAKTIVSTVEVSMNKIEPKLVQCRILAITLPSDILHQATLINTALLPVYCTIMP